MNLPLRSAGLLLLAAVALAACAAKGGPAADRSGGVPTTAPPAATTPATQTLDEAPAVLPDGRHPVYLTTIDPIGKTVTFDLVVFLTGAEATKQAKHDHPELGDDAALAGYYVVNNNPRLRTLPLAPGVSAKEVNTAGPIPTDLKPVTVQALSTEDIRSRLFWLTVAAGQITTMEEQYLP